MLHVIIRGIEQGGIVRAIHTEPNFFVEWD
jgi:hypothetical protein